MDLVGQMAFILPSRNREIINKETRSKKQEARNKKQECFISDSYS
jgi:hypothetical protein